MYESRFWCKINKPLVNGAKKLHFGEYILSFQLFFFPSNFLGLTAESASLKLLVSHKLSRMEVIKFVVTKEMFFGTET